MTLDAAQEPAPEAGLLDVRMFPESSVAAQNDAVGQEMSVSTCVASMCATDQEPPPLVGVVDVRTFPALSPATQRLATQSIAVIEWK